MYVIFWLIFAGSFPGIPRFYFVYIAVPRLYFVYIAEPSAVSRRTPSQRAHSSLAGGSGAGNYRRAAAKRVAGNLPNTMLFAWCLAAGMPKTMLFAWFL